ncbi:pre-peptidase C-terminal domain-containing protein [Niallia sp. Man26]|uniref:pre-peptidase C-terminal domain-containing protein n=1 Tax=Niallia sp. Man26 TaxID=2912824 RepID=UPI001EDBAAEE|nr:pre-peptidase C-terminal domain-containing protein [Niallia sp. Man26]UPO90512.1 pre-peptidase C-terminal domain-containing protein [Niallia sp. Man26]
MLKKFNVFIFSIILVFLSFSTSTKAAAINRDIENNNSINSASLINVNTSYSGVLTGYSDLDYYKFTLSSPGNVTLEISNANGTKRIKLLDSTGEEFTSFNNRSNLEGNTSKEVGLPAGSYYVLLDDNYDSNAKYEFTVKYNASNNYEKEWNDSFRAANQINLNQVYKGTLQNGSDEDYFKFTLTSPGNVKLNGSNIDRYKRMGIYDANGNNFAEFTTKDGYEGNSSVQVGLPIGTYYVRISDYPGSDIAYAFSVEYTKSDFYEKEWNDSFVTANNIALNQTYKGILQNGSDEDYFKFSLPASSSVNIELSNADRYKTFYVYNQAGSEVANLRTVDNGSGNSVLKLNLTNGNYFIRVANYPGSYISYQFNVKATFITSTPASDQVAVTNNTGKSDVVSVGKLKTGDIVKIYDKSGKLLGTSKAVASGSTSTTVSISQIGKDKGSIFITVTSPTMKESSKKEISFAAEKISETLKSSQVSIKNNKGKNDTVTVNGLQAGNIVKVYDSKGKLISTSKAVEKGKTSTSVSIKQLGTKKGSVQVTVTMPGKLESSKLSKSFSGEVTSATPSVSNVSASVSMTVKRLKEGDIVKVYNESGKVISTSKAVGKGKSSISVSVTKQVSKQEKFYITVTSKGAEESSKVTVYL